MDDVSEGYSLEQHVEGESRHLEAPLVRWDLAKEMDELRRGQLWQATGHAAKTLVKYADLRLVLIALKSGARLEEHKTADCLSLHVMEGRVRVRLAGQEVDLTAGSLLGLEQGLRHDVEAIEDSAVLLSLGWAT